VGGKAHRFAIEDLYIPLTTVGGGERRVRPEEAPGTGGQIGDPGSGSRRSRKIGHGYAEV
jgi:hypothetical protein